MFQCESISVSSAETQSHTIFCHYNPMVFSLCESQLISVGVVVLDIMTLGREFIDIHTTHVVIL